MVHTIGMNVTEEKQKREGQGVQQARISFSGPPSRT